MKCACSHEQGDSDCPVHPTCNNCGESIGDAALVSAIEQRTAEAIAKWIDASIGNDQYGWVEYAVDGIRDGAWRGK
jgi:hypothetical protein